MVHEEPRNALGVAALEAQGYEVDHLRLPVGHRHDGVMSPCGECQPCYKVHAHLLPPSHRGFSLVELRRWSLPADLRSLADWTYPAALLHVSRHVGPPEPLPQHCECLVHSHVSR